MRISCGKKDQDLERLYDAGRRSSWEANVTAKAILVDVGEIHKAWKVSGAISCVYVYMCTSMTNLLRLSLGWDRCVQFQARDRDVARCSGCVSCSQIPLDFLSIFFHYWHVLHNYTAHEASDRYNEIPSFPGLQIWLKWCTLQYRSTLW